MLAIVMAWQPERKRLCLSVVRVDAATAVIAQNQEIEAQCCLESSRMGIPTARA